MGWDGYTGSLASSTAFYEDTYLILIVFSCLKRLATVVINHLEAGV